MAAAVIASDVGAESSGTGPNPGMTESQRRIDALSMALKQMKETTVEAGRCCDGLTRRAQHLDTLTTPASDASALLTQASSNLGSTLVLIKDAREKFDTVADCEPAIERLLQGAREANAAAGSKVPKRAMVGAAAGAGDDHSSLHTSGTNNLTEQDVYAAADSMEIIRDAHRYFQDRTSWRSTPSALGGLERVHQLGVDAMCLLVSSHLTSAGPAVRMKRVVKSDNDDVTVTSRFEVPIVAASTESASSTRKRLSAALHNRDLMKSVGEYEEFLPLDTRQVRELRAIFECLGGEGLTFNTSLKNRNKSLGDGRPSLQMIQPSKNVKVTRTEKVGSGCYTKLVKQPLKTGHPHLDAYGEARKAVAFASIDGYYRHIRLDRRKELQRHRSAMNTGALSQDSGSDADGAARDAVRCLEHAMVVVAGEKSIYRCVVSPTSSHTHDEAKVPREYKLALVESYSHVAAAVVDRCMDIIETVFVKDAGVNAFASSNNNPSNAANTGGAANHSGGAGGAGNAPNGPNAPGGANDPNTSTPLSNIRATANAAAAGLRILDGVRMLGPSLAKLCHMSSHDSRSSQEEQMSVAGHLCIGIHRTTVKNCAKTLENLAKAIQNDPLDGERHRPKDARVAAVSSDAVKAIRLICPFVSAYKSVTKRRALPWDPNIGEEAGDLDSFIRFLIMRLLNSLQGKMLNYTRDPGLDSMAKSNLFMINNTFYLLEQLTPTSGYYQPDDEIEGDKFKIQNPWFKEKVGKIFENEKNKYLSHWEILNRHLTQVDKHDLSYQNNQVLTLESGRLLKSRFSGFIEDFENIYPVHKELTVIDPNLRDMLQRDVKSVFVPRYGRFYEKYSKIHFSKKNMDQYLRYPPSLIEEMIDQLYVQQ